MTDALSISLGGLATQSARLSATAGNIANGGADPGRDMVNLTEIKTAYKANVAVIKAEGEMQDSLLDILV